MAEFRTIPDADRAALERVRRYAFASEEGPVAEDHTGESLPSLYDENGLYADEELLAVCRRYTLEARVRGSFEPVGGLGGVAAPPEHRRQGNVRELCRRALDAFDAAGVGLVALWPFSTPFYGRLGWASAHWIARHELPASSLPAHDASGQFRPLGASDWERLREVETAAGDGRTLSLRRSETWWCERTLGEWAGGSEPFCYGYVRDGSLAGYLIYSVGKDERTRRLSVSAHAAVDEEAYRALLDFLGRHGAQIERIVLQEPTESDLIDRIEDPDTVERTTVAGPMIRLSSVEALAELEWPDADLACRIEVSDPILDRVDGAYDLAVDGGSASVEPIAGDDGTADVVVDVGTLSQLAVGTYGVEAAERVAGLTVHDESVREELAELFEPASVFLQEFF